MSTSVVANRIYQRERLVAEDLKEMAPDLVLLRGCKPPQQTEGGIIAPGDRSDHPVRACVLFEVVLLPSTENMTRGNPLKLSVGDVVLCRNALVDPLPGNELATTDMYMGVVSVAERAA